MFNTTTTQDHYKTLDEVFRSMQNTFDQFEATMHGIFHSPDELSEYQKKRIADEYLRDAGYLPESNKKYEQWGIFEATTSDKIREILDKVLEYRRGKAAGII